LLKVGKENYKKLRKKITKSWARKLLKVGKENYEKLR